MNDDTQAWGFGKAFLIFCIISMLAALTVWWAMSSSGKMPMAASSGSSQLVDAFPSEDRPGPSNALGLTSDSTIWRRIRTGTIEGQARPG